MGSRSARSLVIDSVLDLLSVSAIIASSLVAPNILKVIVPPYIKYKNEQQKIREARSLIKYMKRNNLIEITEIGQNYSIKLTSKGRHRVNKVKYQNLTIPTPKKWDLKWRIVVFDIPIRYNKVRAEFSNQLKRIGFKMLQKSVWIHPFESEEQVELILYIYPEIKRYVLFATVDTINNHNQLVYEFKYLLT